MNIVSFLITFVWPFRHCLYVTKLDLYLKAGVEEYWILNSVNRNAICYRFENKMSSKVEDYHYDEEIKSEIFEWLSISLKELFE